LKLYIDLFSEFSLITPICCLLICCLLGAGNVESRRHDDSDSDRQYKLFVFGDDYADTGNYPLADLSKTARAWYYPYGSNDKDHGMSASEDSVRAPIPCP